MSAALGNHELRVALPDALAIEETGARLERVLEQLARHHGSTESRGCMLGVAMAQADREDEELARLLRAYLARLEQALERTVRRAQEEGDVDAEARPRDVARNLVALTQGLALMGRIAVTTAQPRSAVRAALHSLRP